MRRSRAARSRAALLFLLVALVLASTGATCGFNSISIDQPKQGVILDAEPVLVFVRVGKTFNPLTVELFLDDTDLIAALGLTHPFQGEGGVVNVGGDLVTVSSFNFPAAAGTKVLALELSGLASDDHSIVVRASKVDATQAERARTFAFVDFFTQELQILSSSGLGEPVQSGPGGSILANATLGDPFAAPPVALSDGGTLRQGFVEAAEGIIANAP